MKAYFEGRAAGSDAALLNRKYGGSDSALLMNHHSYRKEVSRSDRHWMSAHPKDRDNHFCRYEMDYEKGYEADNQHNVSQSFYKGKVHK